MTQRRLCRLAFALPAVASSACGGAPALRPSRPRLRWGPQSRRRRPIFGDSPAKDAVSPDQLGRRYTETAVKFMAAQSRDERFFKYLAHRDPQPLRAGRSARSAPPGAHPLTRP